MLDEIPDIKEFFFFFCCRHNGTNHTADSAPNVKRCNWREMGSGCMWRCLRCGYIVFIRSHGVMKRNHHPECISLYRGSAHLTTKPNLCINWANRPSLYLYCLYFCTVVHRRNWCRGVKLLYCGYNERCQHETPHLCHHNVRLLRFCETLMSSLQRQSSTYSKKRADGQLLASINQKLTSCAALNGCRFKHHRFLFSSRIPSSLASEHIATIQNVAHQLDDKQRRDHGGWTSLMWGELDKLGVVLPYDLYTQLPGHRVSWLRFHTIWRRKRKEVKQTKFSADLKFVVTFLWLLFTFYWEESVFWRLST